MTDTTFIIEGQEIRVLDGPYLSDGKVSSEGKEFISKLISTFEEMRVFAAKQYLETYNELWREEGSPIINEQEFCSLLKNASIVLYDEIGAAAIYFEDSNMFAGHSIEVSVDNHKIDYASIVG